MSELSDREIARVLDRAGGGAAIESARRSEIRDQVLSEFDRVATENRATTATHLTLAPVQPESGVWFGRQPLAAVAAIAALLVGGLLFIVTSSGSDEDPVADLPPVTSARPTPSTTSPTPTQSGPPVVDDLEIGTIVPAGWYESSVAGGVTFELPAGLVLTSAAADKVTFALDDGDATVSVASIDSIAILDAALDDAEADGLLRVDLSAGRVGDRSIARRDLTVMPSASDADDC